MVRAVDFYLCKYGAVRPSNKHTYSMEMEMASQIDEKTRIPVGWMMGMISGFVIVCSGVVGGAVLYVTDMKTNQAVTAVNVANLDSRVTTLEGSLKEAILDIRNDLKDLTKYVNDKEMKRDGTNPSNK